jgi:hypothetical protein
LTKRYDEQIDVTPDPIDGDAPLTFLWRGRRYQIDQRLESWREGSEWWRAAGSQSKSGRPRPDAGANGKSGRPRPDAGANGNSGRPRPDAGPNGNLKEREFYRVLARPFGASASGDLDPDGFLVHDSGAVYDLYRDRIEGVWKLARVWD